MHLLVNCLSVLLKFSADINIVYSLFISLAVPTPIPFRVPAASVATATLDFIHSRDDDTMAATLTTPVLSKSRRRRRGTAPTAEADIRLRVTNTDGTVHEVELALPPPIFRAGATLVHGSDSHGLAALEPPSYTSADGSTAITLGKISKTTKFFDFLSSSLFSVLCSLLLFSVPHPPVYVPQPSNLT